MPDAQKPKRGKKTERIKKSSSVKVKRTSKSIHISYSDERHVLPHLMNLVSEFTAKHLTPDPALAAKDVLGTDAAKEIVSGCANSQCWTCTLGDLKLDSMLFQGCVFTGVQAKGYFIERDRIPASQDTQLFTVVVAIQGAERK
jgi:hypothetical protein